jgi:hypothetical protein
MMILMMNLIKMFMFLVISNRGLNNLAMIDVPHIVITSAIMCAMWHGYRSFHTLRPTLYILSK